MATLNRDIGVFLRNSINIDVVEKVNMLLTASQLVGTSLEEGSPIRGQHFVLATFHWGHLFCIYKDFIYRVVALAHSTINLKCPTLLHIINGFPRLVFIQSVHWMISANKLDVIY